MNIIISPAKKMQVEADIADQAGTPAFLERAKNLQGILEGYTKEELKKLYKANDSITDLNYRRLKEMNLDTAVTPAVLAYVGLQYQSMAPRVFTVRQWEYVKENLFILSGFYGVLRAMDAVVPYRLEMQAKMEAYGSADLYGYWGNRLYKEIIKNGRTIVNLASKEYSRAVEPYLTDQDVFITCIFGTMSGGKIKVKATEAKMARGFMVSWMAENEIEDAESLKEFCESGYRYAPEYSGEREFVFLKGGRDEGTKEI